MTKQINSNVDLINKKNNKVNNKSSQEIQEILRNLANQTPRLTEDQLIILQKIDFNNCPIVGFSDKANTIYGYVENKWCELTKTQLSSLFFRCKKTIFSKALELKTLKKDEIDKCDKLEAKFDRLMLKLINAEMSDGGLYNKLRFCLYNRIKKDIKNIVEYDLEF